jgi:hypothetical protein
MPLRAQVGLLAVGMAFAAAHAGAQRPDFSGTWVRQDSAAQPSRAATGDAAFRRGDMGSGLGTPLTITQATDQVKLSYEFFTSYDLQPRVKLEYAIGRDSRNTVNFGSATAEVRSRAEWLGDTLEVASKFPAPPGVTAHPAQPDLVQRFWLDAQGRLVIDARRPGPGNAVNSVVTTWTKR